jgi:hypothetical protein
MSELESAGYIKRRRYQDEQGKWCYDTLVFDTPQRVDNPVRNTSSQVKPRGDYPYGENPDVYQELINKDYERIGLVPQVGEHKPCGQCRDTGWKVIQGLDLEKCGCTVGMELHGR